MFPYTELPDKREYTLKEWIWQKKVQPDQNVAQQSPKHCKLIGQKPTMKYIIIEKIISY